MKKCYTCKKIKAKSEFNKNKSRKDGLNSICRKCSKERSRRYYKEKGVYHRDYVNKRNCDIRDRMAKRIYDYLLIHPCVDCGESNPIVLEFDHKNPDEKEFSISTVHQKGYKWETVLNEIKKCDVRCANCHRKRTAKQFNHRMYKLANNPEAQ